jgi:excisionase family DNA binding protein
LLGSLEREIGFEPATLSLGKYESGIAGGHGSRLFEGSCFPLATGILDFTDVKEVAVRLRVCTATIYRLCANGQLRHFRVGAVIRIREADLRVFCSRR